MDTDIAIVGSGFSGLGMAIKLRQAGIHDFVVLERGSDVGGTWYYNTYPGCACDVPSHLYSFSFALNPDWTRTYSPQPEIHDYLRRCADRFGVRPHVRLNTEVLCAEWDEEARRWELETSQGRCTARVLIGGMGPLTEPRLPDLPGLERFEGKTMHSARWDHDYDFEGKRVVSIGTGASAIQYVPELQPKVERLAVFQRTPPWVVPHTSRATTAFERRLYRLFPPLQRLARAAIYASRELLVLGFAKSPKLMGIPERLARRHLERQVPDPELRAKVTPDYTIGCKRILPSNRWYPALCQPNVELVTSGVREVRAHSVVDGDGVEHPADAIVFGTGFKVTDMPFGGLVRGRDGKSLDDVWQGSPRAFYGSTVPGFPNLFMLLGPNTGLGHSSMVYMIESQIRYTMSALETMRERGAQTIEVREEAVERLNREIDEKMRSTVWSTGCASWYIDSTGRNATLWPDFTFAFRRRTARLDPADYLIDAPAREREPVAA